MTVVPSVRPSIKNGPTLRYSFEAPRRDTDLKLFPFDSLAVKRVVPIYLREILSCGKLRFSSMKMRRRICILGSISVNFGRRRILDAGLTGQSSVLNRLRIELKRMGYQKSDMWRKWSWNWPQNGQKKRYFGSIWPNISPRMVRGMHSLGFLVLLVRYELCRWYSYVRKLKWE